jgi:hypothetical protein
MTYIVHDHLSMRVLLLKSHFMATRAESIADKLISEGKRTIEFFSQLDEAVWLKPVFHDGAMWNVRGIFEHLIEAERTLLKLFESVVAGGAGASPEFDIDRFNREHTGRLAELSREHLHLRFEENRKSTSDFARGLSDEQLDRRGRHPALGDSSVEDMLKMIYLHNTMHVKDVKRSLA